MFSTKPLALACLFAVVAPAMSGGNDELVWDWQDDVFYTTRLLQVSEAGRDCCLQDTSNYGFHVFVTHTEGFTKERYESAWDKYENLKLLLEQARNHLAAVNASVLDPEWEWYARRQQIVDLLETASDRMRQIYELTTGVSPRATNSPFLPYAYQDAKFWADELDRLRLDVEDNWSTQD